MRALVSLGLWLALILVKANGKNIYDDVSRPGRSQIVGGSEVTPHTFPWQVGVYPNFGHRSFCGGTIICPKFILTAGHCVEASVAAGYPIDNVMVGDHKESAIEASERQHKVRKIHVHEKFYLHGHAWAKYDYAILELKEPIEIKKEARPIFLPEKHDDFDSRTLFVASGWGRTDPFEEIGSDVLKSVTLPWMSDRTCSKALKQMVDIPWSSSMVCAGDLNHGHMSTCGGDSGGPLAWLDPKTEQVKIVGITSFSGKYCSTSRPYIPQVYADVQRALGWINNVTSGCNKKSCRRGECVTKDQLDQSAIDRFEHIQNT